MVARRPSSSPRAASTNAPVQTEATRRARCASSPTICSAAWDDVWRLFFGDVVLAGREGEIWRHSTRDDQGVDPVWHFRKRYVHLERHERGRLHRLAGRGSQDYSVLRTEIICPSEDFEGRATSCKVTLSYNANTTILGACVPCGFAGRRPRRRAAVICARPALGAVLSWPHPR